MAKILLKSANLPGEYSKIEQKDILIDGGRFAKIGGNLTPQDIENAEVVDCSSFAASGDDSISNNRYIDGARFFLQKDRWGNDLLVFEIEANAFLWKMVRTLTGTIVNLDKNAAPANALEKILESRDRTQAGVTAPPTGLFLYQIKFDGIRRHV